MPDRVVKTINGKRGGFVVLVSIALLVLGYSHFVHMTPARESAFTVIPLLSSTTIGVIFLIGASVAFVLGLMSKRLPMWCESWAFIILSGTAAAAAAIHLAAWLLSISPSSWVSMTIYGLISFIIVHVSNWDNPRKTSAEITGELKRLEDDSAES